MKKLIAILMLCATTCFAWDTIYLDVPSNAKEADWRDALARKWNGKTEVVIEYGRIDVENDLYVIELDYLHKWHESLGQVLHYAETGKQGVAALILDDFTDNYLGFIFEWFPSSKTQNRKYIDCKTKIKLDYIEYLFNKHDVALIILLPLKIIAKSNN